MFRCVFTVSFLRLCDSEVQFATRCDPWSVTIRQKARWNKTRSMRGDVLASGTTNSTVGMVETFFSVSKTTNAANPRGCWGKRVKKSFRTC